MRKQDMTVTEFLLARIADDKAAACGGMNVPEEHLIRDTYGKAVDDSGLWDEDPCADRFGPHEHARALTECEAKRAITELHTYEWMGSDDAAQKGCEHDYEEWPCPTISHLAAVYADHEDYRQEWKP